MSAIELSNTRLGRSIIIGVKPFCVCVNSSTWWKTAQDLKSAVWIERKEQQWRSFIYYFFFSRLGER
jgi:hypothetical protein